MGQLVQLAAAGHLRVNVSHAFPLDAAHLAFKVGSRAQGLGPRVWGLGLRP
jgi:hypothetical protein